MQEKQDQKVVFVSLSIHTNFEHEEHTQKKIKSLSPIASLNPLANSIANSKWKRTNTNQNRPIISSLSSTTKTNLHHHHNQYPSKNQYHSKKKKKLNQTYFGSRSSLNPNLQFYDISVLKFKVKEAEPSKVKGTRPHDPRPILIKVWEREVEANLKSPKTAT